MCVILTYSSVWYRPSAFNDAGEHSLLSHLWGLLVSNGQKSGLFLMSCKVQDKFHTVTGYLASNTNGNKDGKTWSKLVIYKALWFELRLGTTVLVSLVRLVLEKLRDRTSRRFIHQPCLSPSFSIPSAMKWKALLTTDSLQALNKPTDRTMDWNWSPDMFSLCKLIISNADWLKKCSLPPASIQGCVRNFSTSISDLQEAELEVGPALLNKLSRYSWHKLAWRQISLPSLSTSHGGDSHDSIIPTPNPWFLL